MRRGRGGVLGGFWLSMVFTCEKGLDDGRTVICAARDGNLVASGLLRQLAEQCEKGFRCLMVLVAVAAAMLDQRL